MTVRITAPGQRQRRIPEPGNFKISDEHRRVTAQMCDYIRSNLSADLSVNALSARTRYSRSHFSRMFRRIMGVSAQLYVTNARMDRAAELLRDTNATVDSIMRQVGYHAVGSCTTLFRRRVGCTPTEYRQQMRAAQVARQRAAQEELQE